MSTFTPLSSKQKKLSTINLVFALIAVVVTILLAWNHVFPPEQAFCDINDYLNCDKVNHSRWAYLLGIPVSFLGLAFYAFFTFATICQIKNWNYLKPIKFLNYKSLLWLNTIFGIIASIGLGIYEFTLLNDFAIWGVIKNLIFVALFVSILKSYLLPKKDLGQTAYNNIFLYSLALFGVNFSLYLTNVELFVIDAICIYCVAQQVLIFFIAITSYFNLPEKNK